MTTEEFYWMRNVTSGQIVRVDGGKPYDTLKAERQPAGRGYSQQALSPLPAWEQVGLTEVNNFVAAGGTLTRQSDGSPIVWSEGVN